MALIFIISPYRENAKATREENEAYARGVMLNSLLRGESPFVGHLLYNQVLNDDIDVQREAGVCAARAILHLADRAAVYIDYGITPWMRDDIAAANAAGVRVVYRTLKRPAVDLPIATLAYSSEAEIATFIKDSIFADLPQETQQEIDAHTAATSEPESDRPAAQVLRYPPSKD